MAAPSGQLYPILKHYLKNTVVLCSSNHRHISSKLYIIFLCSGNAG